MLRCSGTHFDGMQVGSFIHIADFLRSAQYMLRARVFEDQEALLRLRVVLVSASNFDAILDDNVANAFDAILHPTDA
jgi:hypothetical protein